MNRAAMDLSGHWEGIFSYPRALPPTPFTVTIREHGNLLSGETTEPGQGGDTLFGLIEGHRAGASVSFVKTYDDHHAKPIHYAGTLNEESTEITGEWRIPGNWSGTFIMVREARQQAKIERKVGETIDR